MKKIGYFFATFLPLILALSFEFLAAFFCTGLAVMYAALQNHRSFLYEFFTITQNPDYFQLVSICFALMNIVTFGIWYRRKYHADYFPDAHTTFHPAIFAGLLLITPAIQLLAGLVTVLIDFLSPASVQQYEQMIESSGLENTFSLITLAYAVIIGPLGEELLFRGVILNSAKRVFPFWAANLMQAVLFGIFHMNLVQGIYTFMVGLVFGLICEKLGSIYYSIFIHMTFNFFGTVISTLLSMLGESPLILLYYPVILGGAVAAVFLIRHGQRVLAARRSL